MKTKDRYYINPENGAPKIVFADGTMKAYYSQSDPIKWNPLVSRTWNNSLLLNGCEEITKENFETVIEYFKN